MSEYLGRFRERLPPNSSLQRTGRTGRKIGWVEVSNESVGERVFLHPRERVMLSLAR